MTSNEDNRLSDDVQLALARAFDAAWAPFVAGGGVDADTAENRRRLAGRIVELAKAELANGSAVDEDALASAGLIHLRVLATTDRMSADNRVEPDGGADSGGAFVPNWENPSGQAFAPDTVAAMSDALNRCLDVLPLRLPSGALQFISASILEQASRGERDPEKMQEAALHALRTR